MKQEELDKTLQEIRHSFMVYRNGMVADALRKSNYPYTLIYGLQLPQLSTIAKGYKKDLDLAHSLWNDTETRESRLLAAYLFPENEIKIETVFDLLKSLKTKEEAEILSFRLLRFLPFAVDLSSEFENGNNENELATYCLQLLKRSLGD